MGRPFCLGLCPRPFGLPPGYFEPEEEDSLIPGCESVDKARCSVGKWPVLRFRGIPGGLGPGPARGYGPVVLALFCLKALISFALSFFFADFCVFVNFGVAGIGG